MDTKQCTRSAGILIKLSKQIRGMGMKVQANTERTVQLKRAVNRLVTFVAIGLVVYVGGFLKGRQDELNKQGGAVESLDRTKAPQTLLLGEDQVLISGKEYDAICELAKGKGLSGDAGTLGDVVMNRSLYRQIYEFALIENHKQLEAHDRAMREKYPETFYKGTITLPLGMQYQELSLMRKYPRK